MDSFFKFLPNFQNDFQILQISPPTQPVDKTIL